MIDPAKIDLTESDYLFIAIFPERSRVRNGGAVLQIEEPAFPVGRSEAIPLGKDFSEAIDLGDDAQVVELLSNTFAIVAVGDDPSSAEHVIVPPNVSRRFGVMAGHKITARALAPRMVFDPASHLWVRP